MTKVILSRPTGAHRATLRSKLGRLQDNRIAITTTRRYVNAVSSFWFWLSGERRELAISYDDLDRQLVDFLEYLWQEGEPRSTAADCLSGVQHFLLCRRSFPAAWKILSVWSKLEMPARAPPLPWSVLKALVGYAMSKSNPTLAAAMLLAFHCFLRTGEMLSLLVGHISIGDDNRGVVVLPWTKMGQRRGAQETVTIECPLVGARVRMALAHRAPLEPLVSLSGPVFGRFFTQAMADLGLTDWKFRPYSLRRGGATHFYVGSRSLDNTLFRGRWASLAIGRLYITEGYAALGQMAIPANLQKHLDSFAALA